MTDKELRQHVQVALDWDPSVDATDIGVAVDGGVVTLRGTVASFSQRMAGERIALGIYGVKAVANDLVVHLPSDVVRTDTEIAQAVVAVLKWNTVVPGDRVSVSVHDGGLRSAASCSGSTRRTPPNGRFRICRASKVC